MGEVLTHFHRLRKFEEIRLTVVHNAQMMFRAIAPGKENVSDEVCSGAIQYITASLDPPADREMPNVCKCQPDRAGWA